MIMNLFETIKKLSLAFGPSGCESNVADIITEELSGICEVSLDNLGNVTAKLPGNGNGRVALSAGMDETGFMVSDIDSDGYVRMESLGRADLRAMCAKRVILGDDTKKIDGVICGKVLHLLEGSERDEAPGANKFFIDIGAKKKEEAEKYLEKGDFAVFSGEYTEFGNDRVKCKALDSRVGCALLIEEAKALAALGKLPFDLYFIFTTRVRANLSGLEAACFDIDPDKLISVGYIGANDLYKVPENEQIAKLGGGPVIPMFDDHALYYDSDLYTKAIETAKSNNIKFQTAVGSGSSSGDAHTSRAGVKMISLALPCRNPHTAACVMSRSDIEGASALLHEIIMSI